jgi:hypothetical protein
MRRRCSGYSSGHRPGQTRMDGVFRLRRFGIHVLSGKPFLVYQPQRNHHQFRQRSFTLAQRHGVRRSPARRMDRFRITIRVSGAVRRDSGRNRSGSGKTAFFQLGKNEVNRTWRAVQLFSREVPGIDTPSLPLPNGGGGYCTVFNPTDSTVLLRLPPVAAPRLSGASKKIVRASDENEWSLRFDLLEGTAVTGSVLFAVSSRCSVPVTIPTAPSFGGTSITAGLPGDPHPSCGTIVVPAAGSGTTDFTLTVTNTGTSTAVYTCHPSVLCGSVRGNVVAETKEQPITDPFTLTLGSGKSRTLPCRIGALPENGTVSFPEATGEARIFPFSGSASRSGSPVVRYIAPSGFHGLDVFDLQGHRIGTTAPQRIAGTNEYRVSLLSSGLSSGCYLVWLTTGTVDGSGQVIHRKLLYP